MTMNHTTYIFGNLGSGYAQLPDDYTRNIFRNFCSLATSTAQMIVHRDGNLMYYGYVLNLGTDGRQCVGFCIVLNGVFLTSVTSPLRAFEKAVWEMVAKRRVLRLRDDGNIEPATPDILADRQETSRVADMIGGDLDSMSELTKVLPPTTYAVSKDEVKHYDADKDAEADIVAASCIHGHVVVKSAPPKIAVAETGTATTPQKSRAYEESIETRRKQRDPGRTGNATMPAPVEGHYPSLFAELKVKCSPDKFMSDYHHDKVQVAIRLYGEVMANKNNQARLRELRREATKELGIQFSTRELYDELRAMCSPRNFNTANGFDAKKATAANDLYADVMAFADDIEILEAIKEEAAKLGLNTVTEQKEDF